MSNRCKHSEYWPKKHTFKKKVLEIWVRLSFHEAGERGEKYSSTRKLWQPSKALSLKHSWTVQIQQSFYNLNYSATIKYSTKRNSMCYKKAAPLNYSKNAFCFLDIDKAWRLKTTRFYYIQWHFDHIGSWQSAEFLFSDSSHCSLEIDGHWLWALSTCTVGSSSPPGS